MCEHRGEHIAYRFALEQPPAGKHLEEHHAEGPDVGTLVDGFGSRLLGRHVGGGAENHAFDGGVPGERGRQRRVRVATLRLPGLGEPEVEHLDHALVGELDVGGFEVAVDDARFVRGLQRLGDLQRDREGLVDGNRTTADARGEVLAFHQSPSSRKVMA